jgi:signal transduction histidine kinase
VSGTDTTVDHGESESALPDRGSDADSSRTEPPVTDMGADSDDPGARDPASIPVDAVPDPVVGYVVDEGSPVVRETNEAFDDTFDGAPDGTAVERWLDGLGVATTTTAAVCSSLASGDDLDAVVEPTASGGATTETDRYRLLSRRDSVADDVDGWFLLSPVDGDPRDSAEVEVDRIASVISHDLRNPLDVANAHLQAARETGDDDHFESVKEAHDRMEGIIQDVLTLARGRSTLALTADVDVETVAANAWRSVDTAAASVSFEDDLPSVEADPDRLQRLFENLFRNAVEHGSTSPDSQARPGTDGPVESTADGSADTGSDDSVAISVGATDEGFFVADDGVGIPPAERDRVFEPGYSISGRDGGTGLGLTIVAEIAEAHGWAVDLATGPRGGARFEFGVDPEES